MRPVPYIGVTGVTTVVEANRILQSRPQYAKHNLMVGVLVSSRTLDPTFSTTPKRYAPLRMIPEIFQNHTGALNILHFYTDKKSAQHILNDLVYADGLAGKNCHGVQLNLPWPPVELVRLYKESTNGKVVILQCGPEALRGVGSNGAALAEKLKPYQGLVDHVLIDPSGGQSKE
ncbi:MAG: hypothetical protein QG621_702, partial [Patescibacteria group bacterium]|nr:hypothetical protein [Patescibacteria group bacterium]